MLEKVKKLDINNAFLINIICELFSRKSKFFITFHRRPKYEYSISQMPLKIENNQVEMAVIVQGQIIEENDFTIETLKLYKKIFPNCCIILSTWDTENAEILKKTKDIGIDIVLNRKPILDKGFGNINLQIISTYNGIIFAKKKDCKYILKTRTDQRIYATNISEYLYSLLKSFKFDNQNNIDQKERIIALNFFTAKYVPFNISDIVQFGTIYDLENFWCTLDERDKKLELADSNSREDKYNVEQKYYFMGVENYLYITYLKRIGYEIENSLQCYYRVLSQSFIIIDKETLDLYWNKYEKDEYICRKYTKNDKIINLEQFSFKDWLVLKNNYNNITFFNENMLKKYGYQSIFD